MKRKFLLLFLTLSISNLHAATEAGNADLLERDPLLPQNPVLLPFISDMQNITIQSLYPRYSLFDLSQQRVSFSTLNQKGWEDLIKKHGKI